MTITQVGQFYEDFFGLMWGLVTKVQLPYVPGVTVGSAMCAIFIIAIGLKFMNLLLNQSAEITTPKTERKTEKPKGPLGFNK